ncbi:cyclopropane fatty acid synthase [Trametes cingulata]|nr:cyclopropane fatty acid synthase [Trametes cingulata]
MAPAASRLPPRTLRSAVVSAGILPDSLYTLLNAYSRSYVFNAMKSGITKGRLAIVDEDGAQHVFGEGDDKSAPPSVVTLWVHNASLWSRILISHDLGVSEAFMQGDFTVSDLKGLLNLWLDNRETLSGLTNVINTLFARYSALAINALGRQSLYMAKWNVEVAYDISNAFYQCFLSEEMMYSCAIWSEAEGGVRGDLDRGPRTGDLEAAQQRKIRTILKKARVRPGDRLLEIGSGWGAMAVGAAELGCTVDTVTLSAEQMSMTQQRAAAAGLADRVRVHLCDYRELPRDFEHAFDAVVACEMIEAVGPRHLHTFFRTLDWALKTDRATIVITATSRPEHRWSEYQADDFSRHYHWPNCHLPSPLSLPNALQRTIPGKFVLYELEDHGIHYPRTLREWHRPANFAGPAVEELRLKHPELRSDAELRAFKRRWEYMFVYSEVGFARAYTNLNCWTFTRPVSSLSP